MRIADRRARDPAAPLGRPERGPDRQTRCHQRGANGPPGPATRTMMMARWHRTVIGLDLDESSQEKQTQMTGTGPATGPTT